MNIHNAYTTITLEAAVGGHNTKDFHLINSNVSELVVSFSSDYVLITETINGESCFDEFPRKNWDKKLWKLVWARFRTRCQEEEEELEEISAEDYNEWAAASCGMTYNEYIGKPWLD